MSHISKTDLMTLASLRASPRAMAQSGKKAANAGAQVAAGRSSQDRACVRKHIGTRPAPDSRHGGRIVIAAILPALASDDRIGNDVRLEACRYAGFSGTYVNGTNGWRMSQAAS